MRLWRTLVLAGLIRVYPELTRFDTDRQRLDAFQRAWFTPRLRDRGGPSLKLAIVAGIVLVVCVCAMMAVRSAVASRVNDPLAWWLGRGLWVGLGFVLAAVVRRYGTRTTVRRALRAQLREAGVPICVNCGYDLRGSSGGTCPECGSIA